MSKTSDTALVVIYTALNLLIVFPIALVIFLIAFIITLPYQLCYPSSNLGMMERDMPVVELYLQHFESLYPELMEHVAAAHQNEEVPRAWPHHTKRSCLYLFVVLITNKDSTFRYSAVLFQRLEDAGWDRRVVWTFLRNQVEHSQFVISQQNKDDFARVMEKMCSHRAMIEIERVMENALHLRSARAAAEKWKQPPPDMPMDMPIVRVEEDSLEWIFQRGALLIPGPGISKLLLTRLKILGEVKKDRDLEKGLGGHWQIVDTRRN